MLEDEGMVKMVDEFDWEYLLDEVPESGFDFFDASPLLEEADQLPLPAVDSWMVDLEQMLMNDDDDCGGGEGVGREANQQGVSSDFQVSDILLDSPEEQRQSSTDPEVVRTFSSPEDKNSSTFSESEANSDKNTNDNCPNLSSCAGTEKIDDPLVVSDSKEDDTVGDPVFKRLKRQLRNRDAAMRSRERKKMYVKDLEMKSRHLEAEIRRMGRLLQCCYAENQMLRISLQSGSALGSSITKPESAALLLESLLLGSLVWFMALMCLLPLPRLPLSSQDAVALGSVNRKGLEGAAPRGKEVKAVEVWLHLSSLRSKRCRAARTKMKFVFGCAVLFV